MTSWTCQSIWEWKDTENECAVTEHGSVETKQTEIHEISSEGCFQPELPATSVVGRQSQHCFPPLLLVLFQLCSIEMERRNNFSPRGYSQQKLLHKRFFSFTFNYANESNTIYQITKTQRKVSNNFAAWIKLVWASIFRLVSRSEW